MPDAVSLKEASVTRRRPVRRRIAELLSAAVIGALLGFLIWSFTSEAFWLWAAPILAALTFRFPDPCPATRAARDSVISPEVEDALHRAGARVEEAGRANVRPDDVLPYLLDLRTVARYLENEGIEVAALRSDLRALERAGRNVTCTARTRECVTASILAANVASVLSRTEALVPQ